MAKPSIILKRPLHESDEDELLSIADHLLGKALEVLQHVQLPLSRKSVSGKHWARFEAGRVRGHIDQVVVMRKGVRSVRRSIREEMAELEGGES